MGAVAKAVGSILGFGSTPKANAAPATDEVAGESEKARRARSALLETDGGTSGSQLQPGQVSNTRSTLFGN